MSAKYVTVAESNAPDAESEEFQLEADGTLLMSTLRVRYPTATGLRYRSPDTNAFRALKVQDDRILPPTDELGWKDRLFFIVLPKGVSVDAPSNQEVSLDSRKRATVNEGNGYDGDQKRSKTDYEALGRSGRSNDSSSPSIDLLVRGMPPNATDEEVRKEFSKYGELVAVDIKKNRKVENPRGSFAFIRFKDREVQRKVLLLRSFKISGTSVTVQRADMKKYGDIDPLRLFITKLKESPDLERNLREHFSKYGKVTDLYIPRKNFRGYGFITFENPDSVLEAIDDGEHHFLEDGSRIVVTLASPRQPSAKSRGDFAQKQPFMSGEKGGRGMRPEPYGMGRDMGSVPNMDYPLSRDYDDYGSRGYGGGMGAGAGAAAEEVAQVFYSLLHQMSGQAQEPPVHDRSTFSSGRGSGGGARSGRREMF